VIYVKRNPIHHYRRYNDPKDLPFIQWKRVSRSTAYNMTVSKQQGWEQASTKQYKQWLAAMKEAGHKIL
tara:strand:- start:12575 stop:12781 length:207 start_codon:yes stop_codon:yes gene_type:complete